MHSLTHTHTHRYMCKVVVVCQLYNVACVAGWVSAEHSLSIFALVNLHHPLGDKKLLDSQNNSYMYYAHTCVHTHTHTHTQEQVLKQPQRDGLKCSIEHNGFVRN